METDWHTSADFLKQVRDFHDSHARQPSGLPVDRAKQILNQILGKIEAEMNRQGVFICSRFEYRGSSYEGLKVAKNPNDQDLEYDIMFVIEGGKDLEERNFQTDGYARLQPKSGKESRPAFQKTIKGGLISAAETRNKFYGQVIKCNLDQCDVVYNGPAVRINIKERGRAFFSIDLAPHYDLTGQGKMYVPKAPKTNLAEDRWFRSWSLEEKKKLDGMDRDNGCRKMVIRIIKVLRKKSSELASLRSNQIKTAVFCVVDRQPSWKQDQLGIRLMDVLKQLEENLNANNMAHYYMPQVNLLENFSPSTMQNIASRLKRLRRNKNEMITLITP